MALYLCCKKHRFSCFSSLLSPVTATISDGQENRLVLPLGLLECFRSPRIPVHRVVGVLQEIRGFLKDQSIRLSHGLIHPIVINLRWFILLYLKSEAQLNSLFTISPFCDCQDLFLSKSSYHLIKNKKPEHQSVDVQTCHMIPEIFMFTLLTGLQLRIKLSLFRSLRSD
jgi:hypothetical protein